jgi:hypothetical protein
MLLGFHVAECRPQDAVDIVLSLCTLKNKLLFVCRGKPVIIEWKKSDKQKPEIEKTYDAPLQLSAYFGAMNYDVNYNFQVTYIETCILFID